MHITKDGRMYSETDCKAWFARLCRCGHEYGIHIWNESCHHQDAKGGFCSCRKFRLAKRITRVQVMDGLKKLLERERGVKRKKEQGK